MRRLLQHPLFITAFSLAAVFFLLSLYRTAQKSKVSQKNVNILEQNISNLASEIQKEKYSLELSKTKLAKEKIIRNELLMQKPGEYVLQLPEKLKHEEDLNSQENQINPNLEKWRQLIF